MKPVTKKALAIAVPIVLVGAFALGLRPKPVAVDLGAAARGPLRVTMEEEGKTRIRDRFMISAPTAGRILRIELEPGDPVRAGDVVAVMRPGAPQPLDARTRANLQAQVRSAEAALGRARADRERALAELRYARSDAGRIESLGREGIVSKERVEVAELSLERSRAAVAAADYEIRAAQHQLEAARASLLEEGEDSAGATIELRSPVAGSVLRRRHESESVVPAGEALLEIGDPEDLEVVADLLSTDAARLRPGQLVEIEAWAGAPALRGRVKRIEPAGFTKISALGVEEQRVDVVIAREDTPGRWAELGDAYRVDVRVDVLQVPTSALFRDNQGWAVFAIEGGKARRRSVEVGRQSGLAAEIVSGLRLGEKVIVHPGAEIKDGVAVEERRLGE
jgi:HlyD family secretion protein